MTFLSRLDNFLGISDLSPDLKTVFHKFTLFQTLYISISWLSQAILTLFLIDQVGYAETGIVLSFMLIIKLIIDYPSGILSDSIGQRWVLLLAYIGLSLGFYLISISSSIDDLLLAVSFYGFGLAQRSGALQTWFDNNYNVVVGDQDPERKIYGYSISRSRPITFGFASFSTFLGGTLANLTSRSIVFQIQAITLLFLAILTLIMLTDLKPRFYKKKELIKERKSTKILKTLYQSLFFTLLNRFAFFFVLGQVFVLASFEIFFLLINTPLIYGYSGSDSATGFVQGLLHFSLIVSGFVVASLSRKVKNNSLPWLLSAYVIFYFSILISLLTLFPYSNSFNPIGILVLLFNMLIVDGIIGELAVNLQQRVSVDLIPSEIRNSIYSLIPSLTSLMGLLLLPIVGFLIENYDMAFSLVLLLLLSTIGGFCFFLVNGFERNILKN